MNEQREPQGGWAESLGAEAANPAQPKPTGEVVWALGREWRLSTMENRLKAQFEQWVRSRAVAAINDIEQEQGPEVAASFRSSYLSDRGAGHYNWDGRHCRSARTDVPGICHMLYLMLRRCHPDVTPEQADAIFRENSAGVALAFRWALGNPTQPTGQPAPAPAGNPGATGQPAYPLPDHIVQGNPAAQVSLAPAPAQQPTANPWMRRQTNQTPMTMD